MRVTVAKWGNSLAVRIPAGHAKEIGLSANVQAELSIEGGKLVLAPVSGNSAFDLDRLIAQITDDNRHDEVGTGAATGREFR
jgi:antitoxin MazE